MNCTICPRRCPVDRSISAGYCKAGSLPRVARAMLHRWEEPPISGKNGAGAVFFSGCNLRCVFCQNMDISAKIEGIELNAEQLAQLYLRLEQKGAHTIDLVTPTPHASAVRESLEKAKVRGLSIPVVWNSNGYETVEMLQTLEGLVDIYLPDFKYVSSDLSKRYSDAADYCETAGKAMEEMYRQCGAFTGEKGVLIRHMLLPGCIHDTRAVIDRICDAFGADAHISLMRQYTPMYKALELPFLNRKLTKREYERGVDYAIAKGMTNVYTQKGASASSAYTPEFDLSGIWDE